LYSSLGRRALRAFPTRRSSDLCPIGPAPVISTSSPTRGNLSAVCTALPSGSKTAPSSGLIRSSPPPDSCTHTFWCGRVTYSAKRSEEHTSELQSRENIVCRLLL